MERIICLAIGYVCGLLQTGYLVGKMNHVDIRKEGSGNAGSTNALRVMGWKDLDYRERLKESYYVIQSSWKGDNIAAVC